MTQIIKKRDTLSSALPAVDKKAQKNMKAPILKCLFQQGRFVSLSLDIRALSAVEIRGIAAHLHLPYRVVCPIINSFLVNLVYFRRFLRTYQFTHVYTNSLRKMLIYLRKIHRLAPVFDLQRAKTNARILKKALKKRCFTPQFTTQLAIVLYATDLNDPTKKALINQTNLRILCDCSAYAFHRTRNRLGLGSGKRY